MKVFSRKKDLSPYERLKLARSAGRPGIYDYAESLFDDFLELSGDRSGLEDRAIVGGIALFEGTPVTLIGHRRGKNTRENVECNFGMAGPGGYRKALRLMRQAEKFRRPVITIIDTPGAYPGIEAEENGISTAIAENLAAMSTLRTPVISVVTGEGNSGGALGIGAADRILMLENAVYSILSPEGFAAILWKDGSKVKQACEVMKITAHELLEAGLIDGVIPEPEGGIQADPEAGTEEIRRAVSEALRELSLLDEETLREQRYEKYRTFEGVFRAEAEKETE